MTCYNLKRPTIKLWVHYFVFSFSDQLPTLSCKRRNNFRREIGCVLITQRKFIKFCWVIQTSSLLKLFLLYCSWSHWDSATGWWIDIKYRDFSSGKGKKTWLYCMYLLYHLSCFIQVRQIKKNKTLKLSFLKNCNNLHESLLC